MRRVLVRLGLLALLFYAGCGGRTTLVDISEQAAGDSGNGGKGSGGKGSGGKGGVGGATGGTGGTGGSTGGGPAGTGGVDWCNPYPCRNGGLCSSLTNGWMCKCQPGTFGEDCSGNEDDCNPNPCVNGLCEDEIGGFNCVCDPGFEGELCEDRQSDCSPDPCLNGGTCLIAEDGFDCDCPDGYRGRRCEIRREPCNPNPCQNGGVCIDQMTDFLCACLPGFTGERCQTSVTPGDCPMSNPCQNGGICKPTGGGGFTCECTGGFAPPLCQCRGDDAPDPNGDCVLASVCGLPPPQAFASGECSDNTEEFANWWCQLGGYAEAASYNEITSGSLLSHYYRGGQGEVLSTCAQVIGPVGYTFQSYCTGVTALACRGAIDNELRSVLMVCGTSSRDPNTFIPPGADMVYVSGCSPDSDTQALMITRNGVFGVNDQVLRSYLDGGGIVVTEYSTSDEIWNQVLPDVVQPGLQLGSCLDNVPTVVQFSPMDPFWQDNMFPMISPSQTGCGYSVGHYPNITPLAGWDGANVGLGYRNVGRGRLWAADFDWQDPDDRGQLLPAFMSYLVTHRR